MFIIHLYKYVNEMGWIADMSINYIRLSHMFLTPYNMYVRMILKVLYTYYIYLHIRVCIYNTFTYLYKHII